MHRSSVRDADSHSNTMRRSSVCDPNRYSMRRRSLRNADSHSVPGRRELPNANALHWCIVPHTNAYSNPAGRYTDAYTVHASVGRALPDSDTLTCAGPV